MNRVMENIVYVMRHSAIMTVKMEYGYQENIFGNSEIF